ncbi:MAG: ATP-dependent sacrificial sulfur transferase LarE [Planctomycetota bacterium]|jgi:uncharacterized protein
MSELSAELADKRDRLLKRLESYQSCAVAFSGGLDSTVLAKAAQLALGDRAVAVTGVSASLAAGELDECQALAERIGIRNTPERCYHCKTELFVQVEKLSKRLGVAVVADGSNRDDHGEHRPGLRAAKEQMVHSPLAECRLTKPELRLLAAYWDLPTWDKPATPCLSSRIAYGEQVTPERLAMIDRAERFLRERGFQPLRVRYHKGDVARIEVAPEEIAKFADPEFRGQVVGALKSAGFQYVAVDLEGFRSGSLNEILPAQSLEILSK